MTEYGLFNGDSCDHTLEQTVEGEFYSLEEAQKALARYPDDDDMYIHEIEQDEDEGEVCKVCGGGIEEAGLCSDCEFDAK
jgi:hypothetical protein